MAKVRIFKRNSRAYLELPGEIADYDELELFGLKQGYYLLSLPLGSKVERRQINDTEKAVLKKLLSIRFEKRTPAYVAKALSESEKLILRELERRGLVNVFRGKKYVHGVYNIKDDIYPLLAQKGQGKKQQEQASDEFSLLRSQGFLIVNNRNQAYQLSQRLNKEMKSGSVVGVKGFDGKFYIVTRSYLTSAQSSISSVLKEDMDAPSIASAARLEQDGCMAVLRLMAEKGEIIEKKKGVFAPV